MKPNEEIQYIPIESQWNIREIKKGVDYSWSDLIDLYTDLSDSYDVLEKEFEKFKQNVEDNYREITPSEMYDISDKDFM